MNDTAQISHLKTALLEIAEMMNRAASSGFKVEFVFKTDLDGVTTLENFRAWQEIRLAS